MTTAVSVKDRLKNQAKISGRTMQDELVTYGLERTIYRLSVSKYAENFTLKGGIFLYALFDGEFKRATRDIDLLASCISNDANRLEEVFKDIFSITCDDALRYDLDSVETKNITEFKEYHGVNVSVKAYLDRTRIPISVDIGYGDIIIPKRVKMTFPVILDMEAPVIFAYSVYSVIAEKFEAIVSLGTLNSRYKDFFDIFMLASEYDLEGDKLQKAVRETFAHRHTAYDDIAAFSPDFAEDQVRSSRWGNFIRKTGVKDAPEFSEVSALLRKMLLPVVDAIANGIIFSGRWDKSRMNWAD